MDRLAALCGLLYPLFLFVGDDIVAPVAGEAPGRGTSAQEVVEWALASDTPRFFVGRFLGFLSLLFLLVFVAYVARELRRVRQDFLANLALAGGILFAGFQLLGSVAQFTAIRWADEGLDPALIALTNDLQGTFGLAFLPLVLFLVAVGAASLRGELVPRWLAWGALVLAVAFVAGEAATTVANESEVGVAFVPVLFLWFVWLPAASIGLARRAQGAEHGG